LLAIIALFLAPLLAAVLMFNGQLPLLSDETVNQGKLIQPPVALDWSAAVTAETAEIPELLGSWIILFLLPAPCEQDCLQKVTGLRQVHRATGPDQQRIEIVLLSEAQLNEVTIRQLLAISDHFILLTDPSASLQQSVRNAQLQNALSENAFTTYLVDPLGNIMMAYDAVNSDSELSKDLKRLLKWSKQDKGS
jgi:cytochrome oxidase Cu insertion factor (SCO1/SenC/PrrC family)